MPVVGVILHHSVCPSINGKGYDYFITRSGGIIPGSEPTSPEYIHICIEGDFHAPPHAMSQQLQEQLFVAQKLLLILAARHGFAANALLPHNEDCPGGHFPWTELVISAQDGYH
ncbi:hypothetical protein ACFFK0_21070 [Paenibacillus chartarius]|uniref:N-acetylmuramoyl-L-alanine amidase n=1 Tax=Paenibacillus chartarius TaxID=747481 RepID=A0ABV6DQH5_9BACL